MKRSSFGALSALGLVALACGGNDTIVEDVSGGDAVSSQSAETAAAPTATIDAPGEGEDSEVAEPPQIEPPPLTRYASSRK